MPLIPKFQKINDPSPPTKKFREKNTTKPLRPVVVCFFAE
jgi:hypothetical protein